MVLWKPSEKKSFKKKSMINWHKFCRQKENTLDWIDRSFNGVGRDKNLIGRCSRENQKRYYGDNEFRKFFGEFLLQQGRETWLVVSGEGDVKGGLHLLTGIIKVIKTELDS